MTVLGLLSNLMFLGSLSPILQKFLTSIGSSFPSLAPFTLGLSMVGKLGSIRACKLIAITTLVVYKNIITPFLTLYMVEKMAFWMDEAPDPGMCNFAFLYGTFPTALGVSSYAGKQSIIEIFYLV